MFLHRGTTTVCGCAARFLETAILGRSGNASSRLALGASLSEKNRHCCISELSIALLNTEFKFLHICL